MRAAVSNGVDILKVGRSQMGQIHEDVVKVGRECMGDSTDKVEDLARIFTAPSKTNPYIQAVIRVVLQRTEISRRIQTEEIGRYNMECGIMRFPLVSVWASGARITDADSNAYVDFSMGFGSILLGHNSKVARAALTAVLCA